MNPSSYPVPDLIPRVASASRPGIRTQYLTRRIGLLAATVALLAISPLMKAQTTFMGIWYEWTQQAVYGGGYSVYIQPLPSSDYIFEYRPLLATDLQGNKITTRHWMVWSVLVPGQQGGNIVDPRWNTGQAWSDGTPDLNTDVWIMDSHHPYGPNLGAIELPTVNQGAATARSLTVFDAHDTGDQQVTISGGTLNLTPLAFNESFRVGVASGDTAQSRSTTLTLDAMTLTSAGIAMIGVGAPPGAASPVTGDLVLQNNAHWFHPAGLIEIGGGDGIGHLTIGPGSGLAGSLIPGAEANPQMIIKPGSHFNIELGGTARLAELHLDSGLHEQNNYGNYSGVTVSGNLETALLHLGETASGAWAQILPGSTSQLGEVIIENHGTLSIAGTAAASSIALRDGVIVHNSTLLSTLLIGEAGNPAGSIILFKMAEAAGSSASFFASNGADTIVYGSARLGEQGTAWFAAGGGPGGTAFDIRGNLELAPSVPGSVAHFYVSSGGTVSAHGSALLGGYGNATVHIETGGVLDIRGNATLGLSQMWSGGAFGSGTVTVTGAGSIFRAQDLSVGHTYDEYRWQPGESLPIGNLNIGSGGRVELAGETQSGSGYTYNYPGELTIGKGGTLDILDASGTVVFADPSNGGILNGNARLTNSGTIKGGGTGPSAGANIDFGLLGGTIINSGTIDVGHSPGWLTVNGDVSFGGQFSFTGNGRLLIDLGGPTPGLNYDVLDVRGDADLTGGTVEFSLLNGFAPQLGNTFYFLPVSGTVTGMFSTLIDHTGLGLTLADLSLAPGGGLQLTMPVSAIPEVGTILLPLAAAALAGFRLRRKWLGRREG